VSCWSGGAGAAPLTLPHFATVTVVEKSVGVMEEENKRRKEEEGEELLALLRRQQALVERMLERMRHWEAWTQELMRALEEMERRVQHLQWVLWVWTNGRTVGDGGGGAVDFDPMDH